MLPYQALLGTVPITFVKIQNFKGTALLLSTLITIEPGMIALWNFLKVRRVRYEIKSEATTQKMRKSCWAAKASAKLATPSGCNLN